MKSFFSSIGRFFRDADIILLVLSLVGTFLGILLINSIVRNFESGNELQVQIGSVVIGLILFVLFSYVDIDILADKSVLLMIFSVALLSTLFIWGVGDEVGNRAWLRFWGIGIQPAEIVKVPFIIIMAKMIVTFKERRQLNNFLSLLQIILVSGIILGLMLYVSDDLGSGIVYIFVLALMLFVAGLRLRWFLLGVAVVAAGFPFVWENFLSELQRARILAPYAQFFPDALTPEQYARFTWQVNRSVSAISSGGILGTGLGEGTYTQRPGFIPAHHTDFIFAAVGEELGFLGGIFVVVLLVSIVVRCIYVGTKSNNSLGMLVCSGVAAMIIAHMLINIGMAMGIMPVIGIGLPFISYGGSAIVTLMASMGIVSGIKMRPKPARFRGL